MENNQSHNIGVQDLQQVLAIIDIASKRGAFTDPKEFAEIGRVYTKLNNFVSHAIEQSKAEAEAEAAQTEVAHTEVKSDKKGKKNEQA